MTVHHINAGTMCPLGRKLITGEPGMGKALVTCHCLVIESSDGLILVDTGLGTEDLKHPYRRLGAPFKLGFGVQTNPEDTALARVRALGHGPGDVRHVIPTHLDLDHAGGLPDFPGATVHVTKAEHDAAVNPSVRDRPRYRHKFHFAHNPNWELHDTGAGGDDWFGFESVRMLEGVDPEVLLIPLPGHSVGHTAVAVRDGEGWMLHCGDAYFNRSEMATPPRSPAVIRNFETAVAADNKARLANQTRLRELAASHGDEVRMFCAHDHVELEREQARS